MRYALICLAFIVAGAAVSGFLSPPLWLAVLIGFPFGVTGAVVADWDKERRS